MRPVKCQLALQGGGARIYAIIAALESISKAEQEKRIHVTRISGTSAGAIAGGMYAAGIAPEVLRTFLGHADIRPILDPPIWPFEVKRAWLTRVARGRSAGSERATVALLTQLLSQNGVSPTITLGEVFVKTRRRLAVVATDARGRQPKVFTTEGDDRERLVDVMMHSAALPFFFRNVPRTEQPMILDGGLCMNLPTDCLLPHVNTDGRIIALTFRETTSTQPKTVVDLGALLLDIAMHSSVLRSRSAPGITALELDCGPTATLDFTMAQTACRDVTTEYVRAREQTGRFLETFAKAHSGQVVGSDFWEVPGRVMDVLYGLYHARDRLIPFKLFRRLFHVTIDKPDDADGPARVRQEFEFSPGAEEIAMMAPQISVTTPASIEAVWVRVEQQGSPPQEVPCSLLPFRRSVSANPLEEQFVYGLLLVFTPVLGGNQKYTATIEYSCRGLLQELADPTKKSEAISSSSPRAEGTIDEYELAIFAPPGALFQVAALEVNGVATMGATSRRPPNVSLAYDAHVFHAHAVQPKDSVGVLVTRT